MSIPIYKQLDIQEDVWKQCLLETKTSGQSLLRLLTIKSGISEEVLLKNISELLDIPFERINIETIDTSITKYIPAKIVTYYSVMPLRIKQNQLDLAINDPFCISVLDEIALLCNCSVKPVLSLHKDILEAIKSVYGLGADTLEAMAQEEPASFEIIKQQKKQDIREEHIDPSVIKFINQVLSDAIKQRATDIHFEPFEDSLRVRYRIDGVLYEVPCPANIKDFQSSISSRIKVMANLDIAEKRRPQDGRVDIKMGQEMYDLRVSIMPTPFGESIGIRLLPRSNPIIGLESLGLTTDEKRTLEEIISRPYGIILVTGPTGSGKTTTLYACLNKINSSERKILTIEDPIEYQLKGVTQMQVEPKIDFTFANALRSMLRHDPDVMMVGEIRDTETAELAVRTSLTGHLVFSTLHTNDAAGAITRLLDMGIDSFLVSSSLLLIIAQRLVRIICPVCRESYMPSLELLRQFDKDSNGITLFHGKGCDACRFTGYQGRTGIFEMMRISDSIRELILKKVPSQQIRQRAISEGMKLLRDAGWQKVKAGITTIEEVIRVTQEQI